MQDNQQFDLDKMPKSIVPLMLHNASKDCPEEYKDFYPLRKRILNKIYYPFWAIWYWFFYKRKYK